MPDRDLTAAEVEAWADDLEEPLPGLRKDFGDTEGIRMYARRAAWLRRQARIMPLVEAVLQDFANREGAARAIAELRDAWTAKGEKA